MNGFLVIGYNNTNDEVELDFLEKYLKSRNELFSSNKLNSNLFDNLIGFQVFDREASVEDNFKSNIFLNGKIFGKINDENTKKLSYKESLNFVAKNINQDSSFLGFDGSCACVCVNDTSIIFQGDIEGYKKVFYYESEGVYCISNNLTYILKIIRNSWKIRKNAVFSYILQRESKWPLTFIEGIKSLPPLTKATYSKKGIEFNTTTLSEFYKTKKVSKEEVINDVYASYENIIKRENSKNIAVTLSGGFDSNCLTKLYTQSYNDKFTAVSLGYASEREKDRNVYDETIYAEKIAKYLKIPFKKYIIDKNYFLSQIDPFIKTLDQPAHDPSSNFLLNDLLSKDGYDTVVSGMGGDAFFASKLKLNVSKTLYNLTKNSASYNYLNFISKQLKFKWSLKAFDTKPYLKRTNSFVELREIEKFNMAAFDEFLNSQVKNELFNEIDLRLEYYKKIERNSNVNLETDYSYALLSNPDEYHADIMAQRNNLNIIMPFVSTAPVLKLLNASKYFDISNREFEMEIFKGINKKLLLKSKSGFSFPYTEWAGDFFEETISFFKDINYFNDGLFNIGEFTNSYKTNEVMRNSVSANQLIWKLTVVKKYAEYHSIVF
jgi:asparagine synthetase B (glutamine-hydrolysing)